MQQLESLAPYGLLTASAAAAAGISTAQLHRMHRRGQVARIGRGTYSLSQQAAVPEAVALTLKGKLSHRSAAAWWGVDLLRPIRDIDVTVGRSRGRNIKSVKGVRLHRADTETMWVRGVAVTAPAQTCVDVARSCGIEEAVVIVDGFIRKRLITSGQLASFVARMPAGPGKGAVHQVLRLVNPKSESPLESDCRVGMFVAGLPDPEPQLSIRDASGLFIGRADFAWPELRLLLETDGWKWHADRIAFVCDRRRWLGFAAMDWLTIQVTWDDLQFQRGETFALIADVMRHRARALCTQLNSPAFMTSVA